MMLVTLAEVQAHLRVDTDADAQDLQMKTMAASGAVMNYLKSSSPYELELDSNGTPLLDSSGRVIPVEDSSGNKFVRWEVKAATLMMVGYLYRLRDDNEDAFERGYLPMPVTALLYPLRHPALA